MAAFNSHEQPHTYTFFWGGTTFFFGNLLALYKIQEVRCQCLCSLVFVPSSWGWARVNSSSSGDVYEFEAASQGKSCSGATNGVVPIAIHFLNVDSAGTAARLRASERSDSPSPTVSGYLCNFFLATQSAKSMSTLRVHHARIAADSMLQCFFVKFRL